MSAQREERFDFSRAFESSFPRNLEPKFPKQDGIITIKASSAARERHMQPDFTDEDG